MSKFIMSKSIINSLRKLLNKQNMMNVNCKKYPYRCIWRSYPLIRQDIWKNLLVWALGKMWVGVSFGVILLNLVKVMKKYLDFEGFFVILNL